MSVSVEALRELHRIHRQIADLRGRIDRGPKRINTGRQVVEHTDAELAELKQALKKARMASDDQQLQLKQRETKVEDLQRKLNECKSNTEFKALKDQIAAENQASSVLEDEILDKLEQIDVLREQIAAAEEKLSKARAELEKTEQEVTAKQSVLEEDMTRVSTRLAEVESSLPMDFKVDYDRMVRARGEEALAQVDGESCGGCYTMLTPQTMNELYMGKPLFCKSCGCLLYLPEDRTVR
jgi:predicted  nucleic acid-binding Zn-ribbon protein